MTKQADVKLNIYILITLVELSNQVGVYLNTNIIKHMYCLGTMNNYFIDVSYHTYNCGFMYQSENLL